MNAINLKTFLSNPKRIGAIVNILLLLKCDIVVEKKNMLKIFNIWVNSVLHLFKMLTYRKKKY
jgi:hypothetical protein